MPALRLSILSMIASFFALSVSAWADPTKTEQLLNRQLESRGAFTLYNDVGADRQAISALLIQIAHFEKGKTNYGTQGALWGQELGNALQKSNSDDLGLVQSELKKVSGVSVYVPGRYSAIAEVVLRLSLIAEESSTIIKKITELLSEHEKQSAKFGSSFRNPTKNTLVKLSLLKTEIQDNAFYRSIPEIREAAIKLVINNPKATIDDYRVVMQKIKNPQLRLNRFLTSFVTHFDRAKQGEKVRPSDGGDFLRPPKIEEKVTKILYQYRPHWVIPFIFNECATAINEGEKEIEIKISE